MLKVVFLVSEINVLSVIQITFYLTILVQRATTKKVVALSAAPAQS